MSSDSRGTERRLDFGHFVDRVFWALITGAALYIASQMRLLSDSVDKLNLNMAVVLYQMDSNRARLDKTDVRLDRLEERSRRQ